MIHKAPPTKNELSAKFGFCLICIFCAFLFPIKGATAVTSDSKPHIVTKEEVKPLEGSKNLNQVVILASRNRKIADKNIREISLNSPPPTAEQTDSIKIIERRLEYPRGLQKFYEYLGQAIIYPKVAQRAKQQGKVTLSFVVEGDGTLTNAEIIKGVSKEIDAEAIRVIEGSPKWIPGIQNGKPVRVKFAIGVNFNLDKKG